MSNAPYLKKVFLASDVFAACLQHALTTEKEEIMGLLIGEVDDEKRISEITAGVILHRSDKQPDRVEISPEQLCTAASYAEELAQKLNKPKMRVLGWYHSHPHITVWPSHVDVKTQGMYQLLDPFFVGLIFSVYQNDTGSKGNRIQLTCFQASGKGADAERREIEIEIVHSPLQHHNLENVMSLPRILCQEEVQSHEGEEDEKNTTDVLAILHNEATKTVAVVDIVSKVALPLCDDLDARILCVNLQIEKLEQLKKELLQS